MEGDPAPTKGDKVVDSFYPISLQLFLGDLVNVSIFEKEGR
jgi:hypothetical protein